MCGAMEGSGWGVCVWVAKGKGCGEGIVCGECSGGQRGEGGSKVLNPQTGFG